MRIRTTNVPPIMGPEGERALRRELLLARDQIGALYRSGVVQEINASSPYPPVDEGTLRSGIAAVVPDPNRIRVTVAPSQVTQPYAIVQELGRRPGQPGPPYDPILAWVRRKGIQFDGMDDEQTAAVVQRKLHRKGMVGRFFFRRARQSKRLRDMAKALIRAAIRRFARRVT